MKQTLIIFITLFTILSGEAQTNSDSSIMILPSASGWGKSQCFGQGNCVTFIEWSNKPVKNLYENGELEIRGDTLACIRGLSKRLDSLTVKYYMLQGLAEDVFQKEVYAALGTPAQKQAFTVAFKKYCAFIHNYTYKPKK